MEYFQYLASFLNYSSVPTNHLNSINPLITLHTEPIPGLARSHSGQGLEMIWPPFVRLHRLHEVKVPQRGRLLREKEKK